MNKFCYNCGKELYENADVCLNCGVFVKNTSNIGNMNTMYPMNNMNYMNHPQYGVKPKIGFSIASMVLGIIAAVWGLLEIIAIGSVSSYEFMFFSVAEFIGYIIGFTLLSLIPSILGLIFAILSNKKNKNGFGTAGLILNIISLGINIIVIAQLITLYV